MERFTKQAEQRAVFDALRTLTADGRLLFATRFVRLFALAFTHQFRRLLAGRHRSPGVAEPRRRCGAWFDGPFETDQ